MIKDRLVEEAMDKAEATEDREAAAKTQVPPRLQGRGDDLSS